MNVVITSEVLQAYSLCPRKAYLLMYGKKRGTVHEYEQILIRNQLANQARNLELFKQQYIDVYPYSVSNLEKGHEFLIDADLTADNFQAYCPVLTRVNKLSYEPTIFIGTHTVNKTDRLKLMFINHVLTEIQGKSSEKGYIINVEGKSRRLKLEKSDKVITPLIEPLQEWLNESSSEEPPVILNKHCPLCQFRESCQAQAIQEDNLSRLDRITPKSIRQYERKGIFTVKQLSYLFKPRKRKKRAKNPPPITHNIELQALAIRTNKIYVLYGKLYFPVFSNRLKEIAGFIGATWTSPNASGLQSLVWRHNWKETQDNQYKSSLLIYNKEDCLALKLLIDELTKIQHSADTLSEIDFADRRKKASTEVSQEIHRQLEAIIEFAHFDYDHKKISFQQNEKKYESDEEKKERQKRAALKSNQKRAKARNQARKIVHVSNGDICPKCGHKPLRQIKKIAKRTIIDLVLTKNGIKKTLIQYIGAKSYCIKCSQSYSPPGIRKYGRSQLYGNGLRAWVIYQRVAMRSPYYLIAELIEEYFGEKISNGRLAEFVREMGKKYVETERLIIQHLLNSPFIHADETDISIQGTKQYIWVFTDGKYVFLKLTETREANIVHEFLAEYKGVLISDFYPGYDSVQCRQQKCWVHLIHDLNNDLHNNPFNKELETFVLAVKTLILPIMETIQKHGLKKYNLRKFKKEVEKFYKKIILTKSYKSDLTIKYQKRFIRYRESLFTFLEEDGIAWHNNTAERAIRPVTKQRDISGSFYESVMNGYLVLLGIRQSCRFQGKSFFKFLFSEEIDLDLFEARKRKR